MREMEWKKNNRGRERRDNTEERVECWNRWRKTERGCERKVRASGIIQ